MTLSCRYHGSSPLCCARRVRLSRVASAMSLRVLEPWGSLLPPWKQQARARCRHHEWVAVTLRFRRLMRHHLQEWVLSRRRVQVVPTPHSMRHCWLSPARVSHILHEQVALSPAHLVRQPPVVGVEVSGRG